jgi:cytochrome b561
MKEFIVLCPFSKYQNMFGRIDTYHDKAWRSSVGVVDIHVLAVWAHSFTLS